MIESLQLQNFRGFEDHVVPLREITIAVGANNAGKSTLVEALRLVSLVTSRFLGRNRRFVGTPEWANHPDALDGLAPAMRSTPAEGSERSLFHRYGPAPAILTASFSTGASITVFVGPEAELHGVARRPDGTPVTRATPVDTLGLDAVAVQPQVAPLLREEPVRQEETIRRGDGTYLAPQHFRNQLRLYGEHYSDFKAMAEATWRGLEVRELWGAGYGSEGSLQLELRDADFVGEATLMGHGLQMWLQVVWFLVRAPEGGTVVLDEPDVYMHPDLQRRLLDLVRERFEQLIIATHSVEIISDVDPRSILAVDRRQHESQFVTSLPGLQNVLEQLGSVQNVQVTRLMRSKSFFLVEGDDVRLLRIFQSVALPDAHPIDLVPHAALGGRGGWGSGVPARLPKRNAEGGQIRSYAILDRDYFPDEEVADRYKEAQQWGVELRVWSRKEIENYTLVPNAIQRLITATALDIKGPSVDQIVARIDEIVDDMRDEPICDSVASYLFMIDKKGGITKANKTARALVEQRWKTREDRWATAPAKEVISKLSDWSQTAFGVGFGAEQIARMLEPNEVHLEVLEIISAISEGRPLKSPFNRP